MCLSATLSFVLLAGPEGERGETMRFESMSCIPGRSERLNLRLGSAVSSWMGDIMVWGVERGG